MEIINWANSEEGELRAPCETPYVQQPPIVSTQVQMNAARFGHLEVLKWLKQKYFKLQSESITTAAHEEMVTWLLSCDVKPYSYSCVEAAKAGHFQIAKQLFFSASLEHLVKIAAFKGNLDFLKWLDNTKGYDICSDHFDDCCNEALKGKQVEVLEWLVSFEKNCNQHNCNMAAATGSIEMVQFTIDHGAVWSEETMIAAATVGHMELVKWLRANGCPWGVSTVEQTAYSGKLDMLRWLIENSCPYDTRVFSVTKLMEIRNFELLNYLRKLGLELSIDCYAYAIEFLDVEMLDWLYNNGCPLVAEAWKYPLQNLSKSVLKWLKEKNCPFDPNVTFSVFLEIDALKWLQKNNFKLDPQASVMAATQPSLKVLMWLKENGCPFTKETSEAVAQGYETQIFQWLVESGCPVDLAHCKRLARSYPMRECIGSLIRARLR